MKVSVIIPFWNLEKYVDRCIESVLNQTYTDFEILAVDNNSSDSTKEKISNWCEKDDRVRLIALQENAGPGGARNAGLDKAEGEYICFVDGDDCIGAMYIQTLLECAQDNDCKIAMCGFATNDENTKPVDIPATLQLYPVEIIDKRNYFLRIYSDKETHYVVVWNKIYHKSMFDNIRFENMLMEDEEIIVRTISQTDEIAVTYDPQYFYTMRQGSIMKSEFSLDYMDIFPCLEQRMEYFSRQGWYDLEFMTMKKYILQCLSLYNKIDSKVNGWKTYRTHLMRMMSIMIQRAKKCPIKSKSFIIKMMYYKMFPEKYSDEERIALLTK